MVILAVYNNFTTYFAKQQIRYTG